MTCSFFQDHFGICDHWVLDGTHYQRTAEEWLLRLDGHREEVLALFAEPTERIRR